MPHKCANSASNWQLFKLACITETKQLIFPTLFIIKREICDIHTETLCLRDPNQPYVDYA